jgi:hypothetical protein
VGIGVTLGRDVGSTVGVGVPVPDGHDATVIAAAAVDVPVDGIGKVEAPGRRAPGAALDGAALQQAMRSGSAIPAPAAAASRRPRERGRLENPLMQ